MKTHFLAALVLIVSCAGFSISANASFVDPFSGMTWLSITTTQGETYDTVSTWISDGQTIDGINYGLYRYATDTELATLVGNYLGIGPVWNGIYPTEDLYGILRSFGTTYSSRYGASTVGYLWSPNPTTGVLAGRIAVSSGWYDPPGTILYASIEIDTVDHITTLASPFFSGSFLVRNELIATPIPAAVFMFAPALLGFLGFRRKMRA